MRVSHYKRLPEIDARLSIIAVTGEVPGLKVGGWGISKLKGVFLGLVGSLCNTGGAWGGGVTIAEQLSMPLYSCYTIITSQFIPVLIFPLFAFFPGAPRSSANKDIYRKQESFKDRHWTLDSNI